MAWTELQKADGSGRRDLFSDLFDKLTRSMRRGAGTGIADQAKPMNSRPTLALHGVEVVMIGYGDGHLAEPARWLQERGARLRWTSPKMLHETGQLALAFPNHHRGAARAVALVDVEGAGGIAVAFDGLRVLRDRRPDLPLILVSDDFQANDFTAERLALCDASLRAPVARAALETALTESCEVNNPAWQERCRALQPAA